MKYAVDVQEMKHYEETVIDTMGVPALVLMERAAMAVAEEIRQWAEAEDLRSADKKILVVAGCGNNGADGLAVARILSMEGWRVTGYHIAGFFPAASKQVALMPISRTATSPAYSAPG